MVLDELDALITTARKLGDGLVALKTKVEMLEQGSSGRRRTRTPAASDAMEAPALRGQRREADRTRPPTPLSKYRHEAWTKPDEMERPDGRTVTTRDWKDIPAKAVAWLVETERLTAEACPVKVRSVDVVIMSAVDPNENHKGMWERIEGHRHFWVRKNIGGQKAVERAVDILRRFEVDPDLFSISIRR